MPESPPTLRYSVRDFVLRLTILKELRTRYRDIYRVVRRERLSVGGLRPSGTISLS
jgi:hypothetical protein